jgi:hypothetical protein
MRLKWEITIGNIASVVATVMTVGTLIWYLSNALAELRNTDQLFNLKIERLEADMRTARIDREMVIDMRADVRVLRQYMDDLIRRTHASGTPPLPAPKLTP